MAAANGNQSFVSKPPRGWLHPDHLFARDGINYAVRYIGCIDVNTSMKVLDFDTRSNIAKECINRVCKASENLEPGRVTNVYTQSKISNMLGPKMTVSEASSNVQLTITSLCLRLSDLDNGRVLHQHLMPNISFASGGDNDTLDYIAYVAKDSAGGRACYVLECSGGLAQDVITTIGQAFELRFKEFLKKSSSNKPPPLPLTTRPLQPLRPDDPEYYNDLPGKEPPGSAAATLPMSHHHSNAASSNLIDLSTEISGQNSRPEYVNTDPDNRARLRDPFDMSPFALNPPCAGFPSPTSLPLPPSTQPGQRVMLTQEEWFHGPISRRDAEQLLRCDGDFLVRESQQSAGQYVLTGMQDNYRKHLLLVDPEGVVRTRDRTFESVSHLIDFHRSNKLPIISAESALRLDTPVRSLRR